MFNINTILYASIYYHNFHNFLFSNTNPSLTSRRHGAPGCPLFAAAVELFAHRITNSSLTPRQVPTRSRPDPTPTLRNRNSNRIWRLRRRNNRRLSNPFSLHLRSGSRSLRRRTGSTGGRLLRFRARAGDNRLGRNCTFGNY